MDEAILAYRRVTAEDRFRELERTRLNEPMRQFLQGTSKNQNF